ncbi:hypothetical protein GCM10011579_012070 [Streptomyces albiflavescens]|uniref:YDG domain-containing protein n=1 Tax=Streptomyces albiflavescens TaxID=1623582 RepID=A0A917XTW1_9ACTN|nr:YDG/SRA domain-containing protein [Streptomyces albiflavescens]GGN53660.1 hypothetical protein GCM10011579_012070 [Streptomyces albiflavescens]
MSAYEVVIGHVKGIVPGELFGSRMAVKRAGLTKEQQAGISWGLDAEGVPLADAIVLNKGYEDDRDGWGEVLYTGAGGRDESTRRQVEDQSWENPGNAGLVRSHTLGHPVRVIRGYRGEPSYSPTSGYRYDGLYRIARHWQEKGISGFQICRFELQRLADDRQELTPLEEQIHDVIEGQPPRKASTVERIVRDTAVIRRVKRWHGYRCQVCRLALAIGPDDANYAEGAHIQALGKQGNGPDVDGNVLCLCPNCHIRLDRGAIYLTDALDVIDRFGSEAAPRMTKLATVPEHRIQQKFVRAHRRFWNIDRVDV